MKNVSIWLLSFIFCCFLGHSSYGQRFWVASTTGNWGDAANWSTTSGGTGGASVPGPADAVTFNGTRVGNCVVNVNPGSIAGLTIAAAYTGTINLNGFTLTTTSTNTLSGGTINGAASTLAFNTTATTTFSGATINVPITGTTGRVLFNGGTFGSTVNLTKTGNTDDDGTGNNTFAGAVTLQNSSANRLRMASTSRDIFNGTVTLTLNSTGSIELAHGSAVATQFNDNVIINYVTNAPARIGFGVGISTMASGRTITINPGGAGAGNLTLGGINFASGQTIALTGNTTAAMAIKTNATFNGTTSLSANVITVANGTFNGATSVTATSLTVTTGVFGGTTSLTANAFGLATTSFNGPLTIEKTGTSTDDLSGGNTYGSTVNIINSGDGQFNFANTNADTFNGNVQINNTAGGRVQIGIDSPGNVINGSLTINHGGSTAGINCILARNTASSITINGNLFLNETNADVSSGIIVGNNGDVNINGNVTMTCSNGRGILFAAGADSEVVLGNGFSLNAVAASYTTGVLSIPRFTQLGTTAQSIRTSGSSVLTLGPATTFNGPVDFRTSGLVLDGGAFNNSAYLEKNSSGDNNGAGGFTFAGPTTIRNSGSGHLLTDGNNTFNGTTSVQNAGSDYISLEHNAASTYNGPVEFNNGGSSNIRIARVGNTTFAENIVVNSAAVGGEILFCESTATATLASGKTITTTGFSAGTLYLQRFIQLGGTAQTLNFVFPGTGVLRLGPASTFNGNVTFSAPRVLLHGAQYNGTASITKTGGTADDGLGGNVFAAATTLANAGSNYLLTGSTNPDTFNGVLTLSNSGSSTIRLADASAANVFNENIILNASSGAGFYFGNGGGSSTLANDKTISAGTVLNGDIRLIRVVQTSSVNPQVLNLDGIAILTVGPGSRFGGDVDFRAPQVYLAGCIYGTTAANIIRIEKEGATENTGAGGNVFNGTTTIINSGSNSLRSANANPDIFNANLTVNNASTASITLSYTVAGNQYNGNITVSNVLGGAAVTFGSNGGASTMAATGSLAIGAAGFVSGDLRFMRFTQLGALPQTLVLTPPAAGTARLRLGPATTFNGQVDFRSPRVLLEGVTFNGLTYVEKTGANDDASAGGNVFNGVTTLANSGTAWFINADAALDQFNNDLTLTNSGSGGIRMADNVPGTVFRGNIVVNSTFGSGIYFCETNAIATATLDNTKTITIGAGGFTTGDLRLRRFTQLSNTPQLLLMTGSSGLRLGPNSTFNGNVDFRAPQLFINTGSVYQGTAYLEKTGAQDNTGSGGSTFNSTTTIRNSGVGFLRTNGGNTFNGVTTLINSNSNDMRLEDVTGSTYNNDVEMINNGTSQIRAGYIGTTAFNGNILVNSTGGTGILFGEAATAVNLADTKTISVGAGGFTVGELRFQRFNQLGTGTPQNIVLTGTTARLTFQSNSTFNSALTTSSPRLFFDGGIFNGVSSFTKTNSSADDSNGGNTFNGASTITNNGTGRIRMALNAADVFNGNMTFVRASTGAVEPAYNGTNTFAGNITTNSATSIVFGANNGILSFTGTNTQVIAKVGAGSPQFSRMVVNKASNGITFNTDASITISATLTSGILTTTTTNFLNFANGATVTGASNASYVDGPVRKTGTDAFTFPVGKSGVYKRIAVGTRVGAGEAFTAEYFNTTQTAGTAMGPGLVRLSPCEHWTLLRTTGSGTPTVTLSWRNSDCTGPDPYVVNPPDLRVASYNIVASRWEDRGNGGTAGIGGGLPAEGTIVSSAGVSVFGTFVLATSTLTNPLPIELADFGALNMGSFVMINWRTATELNNDFFTIQRSTDGGEFASITNIKGAGNSKKEISYSINDESPLAGVSYYRLKQTDFDGKTSYSNVVKIDRNEEASLMVYPNPIVGGKAHTNFKGSFTIYNSMGQPVLSKADSNELDVSELSTGIYIIRSTSGQSCRLVID